MQSIRSARGRILPTLYSSGRCWRPLPPNPRISAVKPRLGNVIDLLGCAARYWSADNASTLGAALAFYCAFSLAPLLVILLALAGAVLGDHAAYGQVAAQLRELFGAGTAQVVMGAVAASTQPRGLIATSVSVATLIVGATTVFTVLQTSLIQVWGDSRIAATGVKGWIHSRLLSFGFILTLAFLLLVSLTISTALAHLRYRIASAHLGAVGALGIADFMSSLGVTAALFALIYRYMPSRRAPWRTVMAGGILTAGLFHVGRWIVSVYLAHSTQPSAFGAASSFVALLLWLYYTAQIFLFGAEFTACLAGVRQKRAEPARLGPRPLPSGDGISKPRLDRYSEWPPEL